MGDVDEIAVERALRGERLRLNRAERAELQRRRREVVGLFSRQGRDTGWIARRLRISRRQVFRDRATLRGAA
jgi:DNA-binding CsgD family transcriptional regulator